MAWQTPKTNWQAADVVGKDDFNRIEGNIQELENIKETPEGAQTKVDTAEANIKGLIGTLSNLVTTAKNNIVAAINEIHSWLGQLDSNFDAHVAETTTDAHKPENVGVKIATQQEAEAGTDNTKFMTPLRVKQVTDYLPGDICVFPLGEPLGGGSGNYSTTWRLADKASLKIGKGGTLRIKFWLACYPGESGTTYGRIYRNGSPVGTVRSTKSEEMVVFTEDIGGWSPGDTVELWVKLSTGRFIPSSSGSRIGIYVNKSDLVKESDAY